MLFVIVCGVILANNRYFRQKNRYQRPETGGYRLGDAFLSASEHL
jgi:hypothetical protein